MSRISVTMNGQSTSPIIWVSMAPWLPTAITKHISISGGRGLGVSFAQGTDNCTCTLNGRAPRTAAGQAMVEAIACSRLTIDDGNGSRTGLAGSPTSTGENSAWIYFSINVTED